MGLFDKKEEKIVENTTETITELDKLKTYIKKNSSKITDELTKIISKNYLEGITDSKKCKEFIDICLKYEDEANTYVGIITSIYELIMNFENTNIIYNLINMILQEKVKIFDYLDYMKKSRAYFTDDETWAARVYEVFNEKMEVHFALTEDKMRIGIYPSLVTGRIEAINKRLESISTQTKKLESDIFINKDYVDNLKRYVEEQDNKIEDKINSTFKYSIAEIQNFTKESLESIKNILNSNPSSTKEVLTELERQTNVVEAFDERIPIKERYEKLLSLKNKDIIYHPKFDEVLKYILIGNTVCLSGPSKCGKTNLAKNISSLLNLSFNNIGNIYDEVTGINGYYDFNTNYNKPVFQRVFENGGIVLIKNIDNSPIGVVNSLNNIISNLKYNPYIFGDKVLTTPNANFRLIMTNNNKYRIDKQDIDNLVTIELDYDENYENSLTDDSKLLEFLHTLRNNGLNITTSTFLDIITHLDSGLFSIEELIINYIIQNNSTDLLKRTTEEISNDNRYNNTLKKILKG